jgi:hypothetical protein
MRDGLVGIWCCTIAVGCSPGAGTARPPHVVGACDGLGAVGAWEEITPSGVQLPGPMDAAYGVNAFIVDPNNAGTVYLGTSEQGIWKSTDCGATWVHINTGTSGPTCGWDGKTCAQVLDTGRQWTMAIDPYDSNVLYANNGFGQYTAGLLKSTNGGVDWKQIWPPPNAPPQIDGASDFVGSLQMDPSNHDHLVIDFHSNCTTPYVSLCLGESMDAGETWRVVNGDPAMGMFSAHDSRNYILDDSSHWLFAAAGSLWHTADSGASWKKISDQTFHGELHRGKDALYLGGLSGILRSVDGVDWSLIPNSGQIIGGLVSDGEKLYASSFASCFEWGKDLQVYETASESDTTQWTTFASPGMTQGGALAFDSDHHILYSSNCQQGFWRVRTQ